MTAARATAQPSGEESPAPTVAPAPGAAATDNTADGVGEAEEAPKLRPGYVKHIATGTFHEVEDVPTLLRAYPDQYEAVKRSEVSEKKVGWPTEPAASAD